MHLHQNPTIKSHLVELTQDDPVFAPYGIDLKDMRWRVHGGGFPGLMRIVAGQQISTKVADALWTKTLAFAGDEGAITPRWALALSVEEMRALGLSGQKTRYIKTLAETIESGGLDLAALDKASDDEVKRRITAQLGFGPWSAQMYLIFCLARPNILPAKDLAVDRALMQLFKLKEPPSHEEALKRTKHWDGKLTAVTLLLWQIYSNKLEPKV